MFRQYKVISKTRYTKIAINLSYHICKCISSQNKRDKLLDILSLQSKLNHPACLTSHGTYWPNAHKCPYLSPILKKLQCFVKDSLISPEFTKCFTEFQHGRTLAHTLFWHNQSLHWQCSQLHLLLTCKKFPKLMVESLHNRSLANQQVESQFWSTLKAWVWDKGQLWTKTCLRRFPLNLKTNGG